MYWVLNPDLMLSCLARVVCIYSQLGIFFRGETTPQLFLVLSLPVNFKVSLIVLLEQILAKSGWVGVICILSVFSTATFLKWRTRWVVLLLLLELTCDLAFFFLTLPFHLNFLFFFCFSNLICKMGLIILCLSSISAMQIA